MMLKNAELYQKEYRIKKKKSNIIILGKILRF